MTDFLKYQLRNNTIYGVYCLLKADLSREYSVVRVMNKKGVLDFETCGGKLRTTDEIRGYTGHQPVYLVVDGKGILLKNIKPEPDKPLIKQIIPTAEENEFIVDAYPGEDKTYVSIARKELVDEIAEELKKAGITIICLALGPFRTANLVKYFDSLPEEIRSENNYFRFNRNEQEISAFEKMEANFPGKLTIDSREIESSFLPALAVAIEYYIEEDSECLFGTVLENKKEYLSKILFRKAGVALLLFVFVFLMVNILFFMHYSAEKQRLGSQLVGNHGLKSELDSLEKELEWKEKFLQGSGMKNSSTMAFYADRIAGTVPDNIVLDKLEINPVTSKIKNNKEIILRPDIIIIGGYTKNSSNLNDWINSLKELDWVNRVEILSYLQEGDVSTGLFSIELGINSPKS